MAYIQPNTRVLLLTGVPLDETYEHTIYFSDINAQTNYFLGQKKYEFTPQTYQRKGVGFIKVNLRPELLYDCNYLMFQNTSYGNKWFYAFVLDVEYVNDVTAVVSYQIDWLQTWWFELTIHECWVDREHIAVDAVGASMTPENVGFGELEMRESLNMYGQQSYIAIATNNDHLIYDWGNQFAHVITSSMLDGRKPNMCCSILCFLATDKTSNLPSDDSAYNDKLIAQAVYEYVSDHDQADSIISSFELPYVMVENVTQGGTGEIKNGLLATWTLTDTFKNKKLLQYPFNILEVVDNAGGSCVYRPELFKLDASINYPEFDFGVVFGTVPETYCKPRNYNSLYSPPNEYVDMDYTFVGNAMPQVPYSIDSYKVWLAQNSTWFGGHRQSNSEIFSPIDAGKAVVSLAGATMAGALGGATKFAPTTQGTHPVNITQNGVTVADTMPSLPAPNPKLGAGIGAGIGAVTSLANTGLQIAQKISNREKAKLLPDKYNAGTGGVASQKRVLGITLYHKCLNTKDLHRIDSYFELYGYNCNELKIPNTHSRPHWNYVKTSMANITGNIPSTDLANIKAIFNNGITFWKHANEVGNYSLNNH